ncbi:prepilin-type N-terminal cleavage/methylation domain-containing protein [Candidatus Daviesbacteria bacterium]|nr:prepilin-type N-terminal cleavage/methylation domain-containing protein [Candidatus Daviesbacteria bacterium]
MPTSSTNSSGFTLLELLIVLVILAILAVTAGINFRTLSEDQVLKKATSDIQSFLRLAQSNSTAGVKCPGTSTAGSWSVVFNGSDKKKLEMNCSYVSGDSGILIANAKPPLVLENAEVSSITGSSCTAGPPFTVYYATLYGTVTFNSDTNCSKATVTVKRVNSTSTKDFYITKGGSIDAAP